MCDLEFLYLEKIISFTFTNHAYQIVVQMQMDGFYTLHFNKTGIILEHKVECLLIKFFELCEVKFITYSRITKHVAPYDPTNLPVVLGKA